jgi:MFS family permease
MEKKHYGWAVLSACCAMMLGLGMTTNAIGQYFVPVTNDLNLGMGQFTFYYALRGIFLVASMTMLNKLLQKIEARLLLSVCFAVQLLCTALMGTFTQVWQWYVAGAVMGAFLPPVYFVIPPIVLSNWFIKKKGLVIGIALAFSGVGGAIMNPILANIIQSYGWRIAYFANAIIAGVVVLPFLMFVIRLNPADKGLKPYGYEEQPAESPDGVPAEADANKLKGASRETVVRSFSFAAMVALFIACGFFAGYPQHLTAYGVFIGHPATLASLLLSLSMIGNFTSKLVLGYLNDRFGGKVMIFTSLALTTASLLLLLGGAGYLPALMIGSLLAGCFLSISSVATPLLIHTVYGSRDYARIFVLLSLFQNLFVSFGPPIVGFMFDLSGSYNFPLIVGTITAVSAICLTLISIKTSKKLEWC